LNQHEDFAAKWNVLSEPERELVAKQHVKHFEDNYLAPEAHARTVDLGASVNSDFTKYLAEYQGEQLPKFSPEVIEQALPQAKDLPLWKRAMSRTLKTVDWWVENINKPTAGIALGIGSALIPGQQSFEKEFEIARRQIADAKGTQVRNLSVMETYEALKRSYEQADTAWGVKGGLEIIFDPLNLVGFGAPGALARVAPKALRPALYAANAVDQFPGKVTAKVIGAPILGAKQVPVLKELFKPHAKTLVKETGTRVHQAIASSFGENILSKNPEDTAAFLASRGTSDMSGAGPFSVDNILNHLEQDIINAAPTLEAGERAWAKYTERLVKLDPEAFSAEIASQVAEREGRAIVQGGQRISLDPFTAAPGQVVKGISPNRVENVTSLLQRMKLDAHHADQFAKVFDQSVTKIAETYQKKVEPLLIRPLSLSHLTFGMFGPMNLAEDASFALLGQGSVKWQLDPGMFRNMTLDLVGDAAPQSFLTEVGTKKYLQQQGLYSEEATAGLADKANAISQSTFKAFGGEYFSELGRGVRRAAWFKDFNQTFYKLLREQGADENLITELQNIIKGELPPGLSQFTDEVSNIAWIAASTGDPAKVRSVVDTISAEAFTKKAQNTVLEEAVELPPDVRHLLRSAIFEGNMTRDNFDQLQRDALEKVLEWNKFQPEAVEWRYNEMFDSIGRVAPRSAQEAIDQTDLFYQSASALRDLPYEMNAHLRRQMRSTKDQKVKAQLQKQMDEIVTGVSDRLHAQMDAAGERVRKMAKGVYSKEIEDALAAKTKLTSTGTGVRIFRGQSKDGGMVARGEIKAEDLQLGPGQYFAPDRETAATFGDVVEKELVAEGGEILDFDLPISSMSSDKVNQLRRIGSGVFLDPDDFDEAGEFYFALQAKYEETAASKAAGQKELNDDLLANGFPVLKSSDPMPEYNVLSDHLLKDVQEQVTVSTGSESSVKNIDTLIDTGIELTKLNIETQQTLKATRDKLFSQYPTPQSRSAYQGDFWEDLYFPQMQEIWDINALQRADLKRAGDTAWIDLNAAVTKVGKLSGRDLEAAVKGHEQRAIDIEHRIAELENVSIPDTETGKGMEQTVDAALNGLNADHARVSNDLKRLQTGQQHKTVSQIQAARKKVAGTKRALREALDNPDSELSEAFLRSDIVQSRRALADTAKEFVPADRLPEWTALQDEIDQLDTRLIEGGLQTEQRVLGEEKLRKLEIKQERFLESIEKEAAVAKPTTVGGISVGHFDEAVNTAVKALNGRAPRDIEELIGVLENTPIEKAIGMEHGFGPGRQDLQATDLMQRLFNRVTEVSGEGFLPLDQSHVIDRILRGELEQFPTRAVNELIEKGFVRVSKRFKDQSLALSLTDDGVRAYKAHPFLSLQPIESPPIPKGIRDFNTTIDSQANLVDEVLESMMKEQDNAAALAENFNEMPEFLEKLAKQMDNSPDLMNQMKAARQQAGREANEKANRAFINYDNRNNFDFFMQRLMPFWMYESRRWPRIANLAASKPAMTKYMVNSTADWEYGYSAPTAGFEFNPMKGTILGGLRRLGARDFPEYHSGFRGKIEESTDWLGRFGFYFAPPITAGIDILQGETGNIVPPPLALLTHGAAAAGAEIPGLHDFVFESRYMDFLTDQVLADNFLGTGKDGEIRKFKSVSQLKTARADGDEEATSIYWAAQRQAAARMIALQQGAILRYRPAAKTEFIETSTDVIEQVLGINGEQQQEFRRLGVPVYSVLAVSGTQRRAIRETMEAAGVNYDAWITASHSLRPVEEQQALLRIDEFWQERSRVADEFKEEFQQLNDKWVDGQVTGPQARQEWQAIQGRQAVTFDALQNQARFADVPITNAERQAWREKFGGNPPLTHPVDEALEKYWSVDPTAKEFIDMGTGETDWNAFFSKREQVLDGFRGEPYFNLIEQELKNGETPLGRSLEQGKSFFREYFGVRDQVLQELAGQNPQLKSAADAYRQAIVLGQRQFTLEGQQYYKKQAMDTMVKNPTLLLMENMIRQKRTLLRQSDPEMEQWYQLFIAAPDITPNVPKTRAFGSNKFGA
jgi:hypothetical protein